MASNRMYGYRVTIAVALLSIALSSTAHREPGSLTTIKWNEAVGNTEIIHRLHAHDAEMGIGAVMNLPNLSVLDLEGRANIALYVEERFHIFGNDGSLALDLVGAELSGNYLLVYQDFAGRLPAKIRIRDDILRDAYPAQINQVNIKDGQLTHSLIFADDDLWHTYEFQK